MGPLDIGIVGGGTAGSAASIFLARAGHKVTPYERVAEPTPVGAGITLQPTGLFSLHRLGLADAVIARGSRIERLLCTTKQGKPIVDLRYGTGSNDAYGLGIHRGALFEALWETATRAVAHVCTGVNMATLVRGERRTWLMDSDGQRHGPHQLIVVADGSRSRQRRATELCKHVARYPWGALWFVGQAVPSHELRQVVDGANRFVGLLPTGKGPKDASGTTLASLFWSLRVDALDAWRKRGLSAWKDEVCTLSSEAESLVAQIHDIDEVLFATYHDVVMHRPATRNVVCLGDAAHATSPQLGQGANLALWDAMVLADVLAEEPRDLARALDRYGRARQAHLDFYQLVTRWLTPFFQGDHHELAFLRDTFMPVLCKVPFTRRRMTEAMLGIADGFSGRTLDNSAAVVGMGTLFL
jgi:2-polyprenyl-6-methoxyphenol hydroxylase-like FAD-dependent oxidoreductase